MDNIPPIARTVQLSDPLATPVKGDHVLITSGRYAGRRGVVLDSFGCDRGMFVRVRIARANKALLCLHEVKIIDSLFGTQEESAK